MPTSVLIPDRGDGMRFYGMPTFRYGGVYWGMLLHLNENPQSVEVELAFSRNGIDWRRLPGHPRLIPIGKPGSWDSGMVFSGDRVIERDNQWWLYYAGHNGYHDATDRHACIGLLRFRKEGFVSIRAGNDESYVLTRPIRWPGGDLVINADATDGSVRVRVCDHGRKTIEGFGHEDCEPFHGDSVRHVVRWKAGGMNRLAGQIVRLELKFQNADLFAFLASSIKPD
jgi:hypothetical protein